MRVGVGLPSWEGCVHFRPLGTLLMGYVDGILHFCDVSEFYAGFLNAVSFSGSLALVRLEEVL